MAAFSAILEKKKKGEEKEDYTSYIKVIFIDSSNIFYGMNQKI